MFRKSLSREYIYNASFYIKWISNIIGTNWLLLNTISENSVLVYILDLKQQI